MSAAQSVRYDFGRCTVEHLDKRREFPQLWGNGSGLFGKADPWYEVTVRLKQAHGGDDALVTLLDFDARELANKILELLNGDLQEKADGK